MPLPEGALVPDVMMGARGVLHMVYGLGDNAWYLRSADNGRTFSSSVKVNTEGIVQLTMGERGPKLALGQGRMLAHTRARVWEPSIHVV